MAQRLLNPWKLELKHWRAYVELLIESGITGCRSFTLIAVAGSLVGFILCRGGFLLGTALLTFGVSLYAMFASSDETKQKRGRQIAESRFGSCNLKMLADSMEMKSMWHAKSRVGHAVLLMLQAGAIDKLENVRVASGFDLACFSAAVFISSASVFLFSKLSIPPPCSKNVTLST